MARPDDTLGQAATGQIEQDGRFVAEKPGIYTVVATCGTAVARRTVRADPRNVRKTAEFVGHGEVLDVHTSDFWVWEGADKRDYAVTGTWGANGEAYFWDVTNPAKMERIAAITVDARTVNDVKVSEDGRLCVISREGASNRRNGMVLIDVSDPHNPEIVSTFDENLTGGVHNLFIHGDHVFALSAGRRYDVIDDGVDAVIRDGLGLRWALMGPFGVANTNADGGVRQYFTRYRDDYIELMNDLGPTPEFDAGSVEQMGKAIDEMVGSIDRSEIRRWRDRMVRKIRALKKEDPLQ